MKNHVDGPIIKKDYYQDVTKIDLFIDFRFISGSVLIYLIVIYNRIVFFLYK